VNEAASPLRSTSQGLLSMLGETTPGGWPSWVVHWFHRRQGRGTGERSIHEQVERKRQLLTSDMTVIRIPNHCSIPPSPDNRRALGNTICSCEGSNMEGGGGGEDQERTRRPKTVCTSLDCPVMSAGKRQMASMNVEKLVEETASPKEDSSHTVFS
jgi:hypothetical protein